MGKKQEAYTYWKRQYCSLVRGPPNKRSGLLNL